MFLKREVLQAAVVGLLVEEGHDAGSVWDDFDKFGIDHHAPEYVQKAIRKVSSVALTFHAHGVLRDMTDA